MTKLVEAIMYLGAEITRDHTGIYIHHYLYTQGLLRKFDMAHCNPVSTPMCSSTKLREDTSTHKTDQKLYQSLIGALLYPSTMSRVDISFAVECLSQFLRTPQHTHLVAAKQILQYLNGTAKYGIHFPTKNEMVLVTYANADFDRCYDGGRPIFDTSHELDEAPIYWSSKQQPIMALSTTKAKYRVLTEAATHVVHLRPLIQKLQI